ncbi:MAG TPA: C10 family peptidase [Lentimicrobium sp.]|nr:C10 family peptidase [Lentimicrobium sp.]
MKFRNLLFVIIAILVSGSSIAAVVQPDAAGNIARNFMFERLAQKGLVTNLNEVSPQLIETRFSNGLPVFYIFNVGNEGWIMVSGDDVYAPVIGYSFEGRFPEGKLDQNFSSFIQGYADQIDFARVNLAQADNTITEKWNFYNGISGSRNLLEGERDVEPLIALMTWNQDYPYNAYCPADPAGSGGHVYAGCVATAMSMIMYYYRYPEVGSGSHSYYASGYGVQSANFGETYYNWNGMQNNITSSMGSAVNAVAELQYHCGVAVNMMYGADGSGAYSDDVPPAIKNYFGYSSTATYAEKKNYTSTVWENMLVEQLDAGKPIYYAGRNADGGHAFVCDGYQTTGNGKLYHFNFGWSGTGNGFFTLYDVGGFSSQQAVVKNFFPDPNNYPYQCDQHVINVPLGSIEDMSGPLENYLDNSGCSWLISPEDLVTSITLTFTDFQINEGDSLKIYAGKDNNAPLLAAYGQNSSTATLTSDTSSMLITFITDGSEESAGFRAEFSSTYPVYCNSGITTLTAPTGEFSDGSGDHKYNNGTLCKWRINPGPWSQDLTLAFTEFDLEQDVDFLRVYDLPTNQLLAELTGDQIPDPIVSSTGQMMLMFLTNGFNNNQGFSANYYISNVNTTDIDIAQNLSIYPNPAVSYTDVKFVLKETSNITISLHNLLGEEVYTESSLVHSGFVSKTIQLGGLSKGIYLLKISSESGSVTRKLIVK